jgi:hypothetical protein
MELNDGAAVVGMLVGAILGLAAGFGAGLALGLQLQERGSWKAKPIGRASGTASANPIPQPKERIVDQRPWESDPEMANLDVIIDERRGVAVIIDDYAQESHEEPLADFLLRYKPKA